MDEYAAFPVHAGAGATPGRARGDKATERGLSARCPNTPLATPLGKTPTATRTPWTGAAPAKTPKSRPAGLPAAGKPPTHTPAARAPAPAVPDIESQTEDRTEPLRPVDVALDDPLDGWTLDLRLPFYRCGDEADWGITAPEI
eukprot:TRINITY_DN8698_c0_g1_i2.p2 TRINITY_DN8698_c0_g1~~TRINITY_DN8698_c0_g1_i2.p2  ORF type:complete len:143 (+),score=29.12 TRINITY_DN8698_c0_g1_i2:383-811(+)